MLYRGSPALNFWRTLGRGIQHGFLSARYLHSLWIVPVIVDRAEQTSGYIMPQPLTAPILFIQREWPQSSAIDPVNDDLLQTVDVIASRIVSGSVQL
jgi:hypothetical protein